MPVYVVFFTLAGAKLHLDEVVHLFAFALALVGVRILAIYLGVRAGAWVGGADEGTKKHGWMGFVSQAGVAITLAGFVKTRFGEPGEALSSLLIAGVAINEIVGPVLLKVGLGLAGEIGEAEQPRAGAARWRLVRQQRRQATATCPCSVLKAPKALAAPQAQLQPS